MSKLEDSVVSLKTAKKLVEELREKFSKLSVLVVGDICLDIDYIGGYSGYSREVEQLPIFRAEKVKYSPGGGGNLAVCFATLGLAVAVVGHWGNSHDVNRRILEQSLASHNISTLGIRHCGRTPVFIKYYFHNSQHVYRTDLISEPCPEHKKNVLLGSLPVMAGNSDFVACADYEEVHEFGVCSPEVIEAVRTNAKVKFATSRKRVRAFKGFDYQIQNEKEAQDSGINLDSLPIHSPTWVEKEFVVTCGGKGAKSSNGYTWNRVSSKELTENIDPCDCGDMFYAIYASSVMAGFDTTTCLQLANSGARCVARKLFGTGQADCEEIVKEWNYLYGKE